MADTTTTQDNAFADAMTKASLENSVQWISKWLDPNQVFEESDIFKAAGDCGSPGDVFSDNDLASWAEDNGYTKFTEGEI